MSDPPQKVKRPAFKATEEDKERGASRKELEVNATSARPGYKRSLELQKEESEQRKKQATESNVRYNSQIAGSIDPDQWRSIVVQKWNKLLIKDMLSFLTEYESFATSAQHLQGTSSRNPFGIKREEKMTGVERQIQPSTSVAISETDRQLADRSKTAEPLDVAMSDIYTEPVGKALEQQQKEAEDTLFQQWHIRLENAVTKYRYSGAAIGLLDLDQFLKKIESIAQPQWKFLFQRELMLIVADGDVEGAVKLLEKLPKQHVEHIKKLTIYTTGKRLLRSIGGGVDDLQENSVSVKPWRALIKKLKGAGLKPQQVRFAGAPLPKVGKANWIDQDYLINTVRVVELQCFNKWIIEPLIKFSGWPAQVCIAPDVLKQLGNRLDDIGKVDLKLIADEFSNLCQAEVPEDETWFGKFKKIDGKHNLMLDQLATNSSVEESAIILKRTKEWELEHEEYVEKLADTVWENVMCKGIEHHPGSMSGYAAGSFGRKLAADVLTLGDEYA